MLDPAHGGTDSGARGEGVAEKDLVLQIVRAIRADLERLDYRVVVTRSDDSDVSYDDRAAIANSYRDAIFVSVHVSSTGTAGTARAYYDQLGTLTPPAPAAGAIAKSPLVQPSGLIPWDAAQRPYLDASHRLADLIQIQLGQLFPGSPPSSTGAAVRSLRSVATPAVALEISSVAVPNANSLAATAEPLSTAIARSVAAFRQAVQAGTK